ncbi:DUF3396 domain-containing protein [Myxococcaceae bacterium GXIMD 01537]
MPSIPFLRTRDGRGRVFLRDGLVISFYMPHSHKEVSVGVWRAIELYRQFVPANALSCFLTNDGEWSGLVGPGWDFIREEILDLPSHLEAGARLVESDEETRDYNVDYTGKPFDPNDSSEELVSALNFTLPTSSLEDKGPAAIRELALAMAADLPLSFGYVSPAFVSPGGVTRLSHATFSEYCGRYPGMDAYHMRRTSDYIGARARGAYWLTFLGEPLLGQLGGAEALRARLPPSIQLDPMGEGRLCVTLGEWPVVAEEPGTGALDPYRTLARVLEPQLCEERTTWLVDEHFQRQWLRRFLDDGGR